MLRTDAAPPSDLIDYFDPLIDPAMRGAAGSGRIERVRPDGYLALPVRAGEWALVESWLDQVFRAE